VSASALRECYRVAQKRCSRKPAQPRSYAPPDRSAGREHGLVVLAQQAHATLQDASTTAAVLAASPQISPS
jgi:hypothetical protein